MPHRRHAGNTAVEYSLMAALVAVAAAASLSLMGNSVSRLVAQPGVGTTKDDIESMVSMDFDTNGKSIHIQGQTAASSGQATSVTNPASAMNTTRSNGVNATSTDGDVLMAMVQSTFRQAEKMQNLANATEENELADWYRETSRYTYRLAGSEATFAYKQNPSENAGLHTLIEEHLGQGDAIRGMYEMRKEITKKMEQLKQSNISQAGQQEALAIASPILSGLDMQYGALLARYSDGSNLKIQEIKNDFGNGDSQYQRDNLRAEAMQVLQHGQANQSISVKVSLQSGVVMDNKSQ
jgi:hypothetical protein